MAAEDKDLNRDPISDEPGAHPVGTGVGAAGGAVAGAAAGSVGGPVGAVVGGVVGAVVGGLAGKAAAEAVNPTAEEAHWRENYTREPYYEQGRSFDDYGPAYRLGLTGRTRYERLGQCGANPRIRVGIGPRRLQPELAPGTSGEPRGVGPHRVRPHGWHARHGRYGGQPHGLGQSQSQSQSQGGGAAAMVGEAQSAGNMSGDNEDVIDALNDLAECCKDGEYGFRACAEQAERSDLKSVFLQRADDCRGAAQELYEQIRMLGGDVDEGGSAAGAMHRGWVAVKATLTTYDDKAVLEECERGEDNAMARYRKALEQPLPAGIKLIVERQMQGVQRNHDQIKMLRDQFRA